jgi:peroxiredoxin
VAPEPAGAGSRRPVFLYALLALTGLTLVMVLCAVVSAVNFTRLRKAEFAAATPVPAIAAQSVATDFALATADGSTLRLSDLRGKVVLLNFWATWCPPCKAEMPDLEALYREYGAERNFAVVGVNMEESSETVRAFAQANGISFPLALDADGKVSSQAYGVRTLPTSMLIDREGRIRDAWNGRLSRREMLERLEQVW